MGGEFGIKIHALVQNTDDLDFGRVFLPVENDMAAGIHFPVAFADIATVFPLEGIAGHLMETSIELGKVFVALLLAPLLLCVAANLTQIGHGLLGQAERGHYFRPS